MTNLRTSPEFLQKPSSYFFHGAFAPSFIWRRRPWPEASLTENFAKFGHAVFRYTVTQEERQTYKLQVHT